MFLAKVVADCMVRFHQITIWVQCKLCAVGHSHVRLIPFKSARSMMTLLVVDWKDAMRDIRIIMRQVKNAAMLVRAMRSVNHFYGHQLAAMIMSRAKAFANYTAPSCQPE